jgi:hypothetical protein
MERNPHGKNYTNGLNIKVFWLLIRLVGTQKKPNSNNQNRYE